MKGALLRGRCTTNLSSAARPPPANNPQQIPMGSCCLRPEMPKDTGHVPFCSFVGPGESTAAITLGT